jgi:hypothetical protein
MAAGLALADAAICAWVIPKAACRLLGQSWSRFTADVAIRAGCVGAVLYAVVNAASTGLAGWEAVSRLPALAALTGTTGLGLVWMVALDRAERARLRPFASRVLRLRATEGGA